MSVYPKGQAALKLFFFDHNQKKDTKRVEQKKKKTAAALVRCSLVLVYGVAFQTFPPPMQHISTMTTPSYEQSYHKNIERYHIKCFVIP